MRFRSMSWIVLAMSALLLAISALPVRAQTPESDAGTVGGRGVEVKPEQRDIVTASNADAFLFTDEYPRADVVAGSANLTCYRLTESPEYVAPRTASVSITWCLNAQNGLVTATSEAWAFPEEVSIRGAFCGWDSPLGERETDRIICKVLIQEARCGLPKMSCINEELNWAFSGDGNWERLDHWEVQPYSYDASNPYPLSG